MKEDAEKVVVEEDKLLKVWRAPICYQIKSLLGTEGSDRCKPSICG